MGGSLSNIFSGGQQNAESSLANGDQNIAQYLEQLFGNASQNYQPYQEQGQQANQNISQFAQSLLGQQNGQWMNQYKESPYAQFLTGKELDANNNAAAAGGILGTGPNKLEDMNIANNVTNQDQQNYFNNMQNQNQQYLNAEGGLASNGLSAAQGTGNLATSFGNSIASAMGNQATANANSQLAGTQGKNSAISSVLGFGSGALSGGNSGKSGLSQLFGNGNQVGQMAANFG